MAWTWRFEKSDGTEVQPAVQPEEFTTQGDAESWIGEFWKDLLEGGADQVMLFEDGTKIYGPMSLHADGAGLTRRTPRHRVRPGRTGRPRALLRPPAAAGPGRAARASPDPGPRSHLAERDLRRSLRRRPRRYVTVDLLARLRRDASASDSDVIVVISACRPAR